MVIIVRRVRNQLLLVALTGTGVSSSLVCPDCIQSPKPIVVSAQDTGAAPTFAGTPAYTAAVRRCMCVHVCASLMFLPVRLSVCHSTGVILATLFCNHSWP